MYCEQNNVVSEIDSRTSDAVALALRFRCPIYTYENILNKAGILIEEKPETTNDESLKEENLEFKSSYEKYSLEELEELLKDFVENEEYEKASLVRDEINRRNK